MTDQSNEPWTDDLTKAPWHLWVLGAVSLLWNSVGAFDFTASLINFEPYLANFSQEILDYLDGLPVWKHVIWGLATWGGFLGSVLLLMRRKLSVLIFGISVVAASCLMAIGQMDPEAEVANDPVFSGVIIGFAVLVFVYAIWMSRRGILR
jgi:hypothetical protein